MLTADEVYDLLAARERTLNQGRLAARQAATPAWNASLQEHYLQQAGNLGLIPEKYYMNTACAPTAKERKPRTRSPRASPRTPAAAASQHLRTTSPSSPHGSGSSPSTPSSPRGVLSPRPSRSPSSSRIARTLSHADSALASSTAAAALAATDKLIRLRAQPRDRTKGLHAYGAYDSSDEDSRGSDKSSASGFGAVSDDSREGFGSGVSSGHGTSRREGRGLLYARQLDRIENGYAGERRGRRPRSSGGGDGGRSRNPAGGREQRDGQGEVLRKPTEAFLRTWRAMRNKDGLRKQVVRFLLGTPGELERPASDDGGSPDSAAASAAAALQAAAASEEGASARAAMSRDNSGSGMLGSQHSHSTISIGASPTSPTFSMSTRSSSLVLPSASEAWTPPPQEQSSWPDLRSAFEQQYSLSPASSSPAPAPAPPAVSAPGWATPGAPASPLPPTPQPSAAAAQGQATVPAPGGQPYGYNPWGTNTPAPWSTPQQAAAGPRTDYTFPGIASPTSPPQQPPYPYGQYAAAENAMGGWPNPQPYVGGGYAPGRPLATPYPPSSQMQPWQHGIYGPAGPAVQAPAVPASPPAPAFSQPGTGWMEGGVADAYAQPQGQYHRYWGHAAGPFAPAPPPPQALQPVAAAPPFAHEGVKTGFGAPYAPYGAGAFAASFTGPPLPPSATGGIAGAAAPMPAIGHDAPWRYAAGTDAATLGVGGGVGGGGSGSGGGQSSGGSHGGVRESGDGAMSLSGWARGARGGGGGPSPVPNGADGADPRFGLGDGEVPFLAPVTPAAASMGPSAVYSGAEGGEDGSIEALRNRQSALSSNVQELLQRLDNMRGRLVD